MSTLKRRYKKWCTGDDIEDCTHKQQYEASYESMVKVLLQNTSLDDRQFLCELGQSKAISITLHMARGQQTLSYGKMKAERS